MARKRHLERLLQGWANSTVRVQNIFTEYTGNWKAGSRSDKVESSACREWRILLVDYDEVIKMEWCRNKENAIGMYRISRIEWNTEWGRELGIKKEAVWGLVGTLCSTVLFYIMDNIAKAS